MKISELAKDLNITSKEVIQFLQDKGYDYKSPQKNLVEEEENLVRKGLTAGSAKTEKAEAKADKKEEAKPDKKEEKEAPVKEEGKETVTKEESPKEKYYYCRRKTGRTEQRKTCAETRTACTE